MVKSCRKTKSKRVTCHKRYKILRKVREHHRKLKKEKKKNPKLFRRKYPGVPNSLPFKEQILDHIKETKKLEAERRLSLLQQAMKVNDVKEKPPKKHAAVSFSKQFSYVLSKSDVVIEVLDARDPLGTRCLNAEKEVLAYGKKLVLLLNKIDLVPSEVVRRWLAYFRKWYTTMPFKANTQEGSKILSNIKGNMSQHGYVSTKCGLGVDGLMALLGNICRHHGGKLVVGLIGVPNTGKSAVINTLIRRKSAPSSCIPGFTRDCQLFKIDSKVSLVDSPGIILSKSEDPCELALRNCAKPESLSEPELAVSAILARCPKRQIMVQYAIGEYSSTTDFLCQMAQRNGRLRKGGAPDIKGSARILLSDWMTGKLAHYTLPPESDAQIAEPSMPPIFAVDKIDFPLQEMDENVFANLPKSKVDSDFCPAAVFSPSQPFTAALGGGGGGGAESIDVSMAEDHEETTSDVYESADEAVADMEEAMEAD
uniref:G domain-containing protein n=1 Tax=Mesocestoides corti TaxID=53468 RepID=A0A5K3EZ96_MESCO